MPKANVVKVPIMSFITFISSPEKNDLFNKAFSCEYELGNKFRFHIKQAHPVPVRLPHASLLESCLQV